MNYTKPTISRNLTIQSIKTFLMPNTIHWPVTLFTDILHVRCNLIAENKQDVNRTGHTKALIWCGVLSYAMHSVTWYVLICKFELLGAETFICKAFTHLNRKSPWIRCVNSVCGSQKTHSISIIKINKIMMSKDTIAVYSESHMRYINIHLPSDPKCAVKFPNNELCLSNNESVRQT